jgi:hypothetical protein
VGRCEFGVLTEWEPAEHQIERRCCWGLFPSVVRANTLHCAGSNGECWIPVPLPPPVYPQLTFSGGFRVRIQAQ